MLGAMKQSWFDSESTIYWATQLALPTFNSNASYINGATTTVDTNNNIYVGGGMVLGNVSSTPYSTVVALNQYGQQIWSNSYIINSTVNAADVPKFVSANVSTGNLYVAEGGSFGSLTSAIVTLNSGNGNELQYLAYDDTYNANPDPTALSFSGMAVQNNGNIAMTGYGGKASSNTVNSWLAITNPAGTVLKSIGFENTTNSSQTNRYFIYNGGMCVDKPASGNNNTYISFYDVVQFTSDLELYTYWATITAAYNSAGVLQWVKGISYGPNSYSGGLGIIPVIAVDGSSNVYTAWAGDLTTPSAVYITQYTGGTLNWTAGRNISGNTNTSPTAIDTDISNNVYLLTNDVSLGAGVLMKFNSSGTLQWQYTLSPSAGAGLAFNSLKIMGNNIILGCNASYGSYPGIKQYGSVVISMPTSGPTAETISIPVTGSYYNGDTISIVVATSSYSSQTPDAGINFSFSSFSAVGETSGVTIAANTTAITSFTSNSLATFGGPLTTNTVGI